MAQTLHEIRRLLESVGARPNRKLGQNFLVDQNLMHCVVEAARLQPDSVVLEVGPGTGSLTEEILTRLGPNGRVVACEHDRALYDLLMQRCKNEPRLTLIHADALAELPEVLSRLPIADGRWPSLVSNLPYQIASPLLVQLATGEPEFAALVFTVQKEVAERLSARPGTAQYGPLGVILQAFCRVERLRDLPPQAFWPPPKVHSSLVRLEPIRGVERREKLGPNWADFPALVHDLLAYRRKTLAGTLKLLAEREAEKAKNVLPGSKSMPRRDARSTAAALQAAGIALTRRAETLSVEEYIAVGRGVP